MPLWVAIALAAAALVAACSGSDAPADADASAEGTAPDGATAEVEAGGDAETSDDAVDSDDDLAEPRDDDPAAEDPAETGEDDPEGPPPDDDAADVAPPAPPLPYDNDNALRVLEALSVTIGERVQATDGERAAAAFLAAEFESLGYAVELQPVPLESLRVDEFRVLVNGRPVVAEVLQGSVGGDLSAPLVVVPGMGAAEDFAAVDVAGAVALVERGVVFFREKVANAAAAGAIAVLIYNNEPGPFSGTLGEASAIPAVSISQAQGQALQRQVTRAARAAEAAETADAPDNTDDADDTDNTDDADTQVTVEIVIRFDPLSGESQNVVARRPDGACRIWLGGHYDTVSGVMGANDNASGTALVVEMARAYADSDGGRLICFAAFGAEESVRGSPGILGSKVFVQRLVDSGAIDDVTAMLNLDVAGAGSALVLVGVEPLVGLAEEVGAVLEIDLAAGTLPPGAGSDHLNFAQAGVPVIFPTVLGGPIHVPADRFEAVEPERLASVGRLAHGLLGCLTAAIDPALAAACVVGAE